LIISAIITPVEQHTKKLVHTIRFALNQYKAFLCI